MTQNMNVIARAFENKQVVGVISSVFEQLVTHLENRDPLSKECIAFVNTYTLPYGFELVTYGNELLVFKQLASCESYRITSWDLQALRAISSFKIDMVLVRYHDSWAITDFNARKHGRNFFNTNSFNRFYTDDDLKILFSDTLNGIHMLRERRQEQEDLL